MSGGMQGKLNGSGIFTGRDAGGSSKGGGGCAAHCFVSLALRERSIAAAVVQSMLKLLPPKVGQPGI